MTPLTRLFINEAKTVHFDKYRYKKSEYIDDETELIVTCHKHGDFKIKPSMHINGCGCPICAMKKYL